MVATERGRSPKGARRGRRERRMMNVSKGASCMEIWASPLARGQKSDVTVMEVRRE
jgi:hypothetical protein